IAGSNGQGSEDGNGDTARFFQPVGVALDRLGDVYVADSINSTIRKITSAGVVISIAGQAGNKGSSDGAGSDARFSYPQGIAVDNLGNIYVADTGNHTIRKITGAGIVTTLAGYALNTGSADGTSSSARFLDPEGIALGSDGTIYVADTGNYTIR